MEREIAEVERARENEREMGKRMARTIQAASASPLFFLPFLLRLSPVCLLRLVLARTSVSLR